MGGHSSVMLDRLLDSTTQSPTTTWSHPTHCPHAFSLKSIGRNTNSVWG